MRATFTSADLAAMLPRHVDSVCAMLPHRTAHEFRAAYDRAVEDQRLSALESSAPGCCSNGEHPLGLHTRTPECRVWQPYPARGSRCWST